MVQKTEAKLKNILSGYTVLSGVSCKELIDTDTIVSGSFSIIGHEPLTVVSYHFECQNRLWAKEYLLHLLVNCVTAERKTGTIHLGHHKGSPIFQTKQSDLTTIANICNQNKMLLQLIEKGNISHLTVIFTDGQIQIDLKPYTSSVVQILIPPVSYAVSSKAEECVAQLQTLQVLLTLVSS